MSYKHLDQISDLYESVKDIENRDNELVNEVILVVSTSMFVEGYTNVAIKNYFDCADPVEIFEKYEEYSKDFLFVDEKTLNESVEHDLVLEEESIKELNLIIEGLRSSIVRGIKKIAGPHLAGMKTSARKALKSDNPVMKKIYGVKDSVKNKIKNVSTKSNILGPDGKKLNLGGSTKSTSTSKILGPDGKPVSKVKTNTVKDTVSNITKTVKDKSKKVIDKSKKVLGSKETKKTIDNILKPTTKRGGAVRFAAAGSAGALLTKIGSGNKENKKPENKKPETKSTQKNYKEGEKPKYDLSGVKGSDTKEKKTSDIGSQIYNNAVKISQSQSKPAPSKPSTASGKETPKPRAIGKGKGEINPNSARGRMIAKNQERFGKDRIKKLRDKNAAFQAARKKGTGYSMDDFVKDFPDSNTAKDRAKRKKIPSVMDYESYDPQISNDLAEIYKDMYNQPVESTNLDEGAIRKGVKAVGKLVYGKSIKKIGDTMVVKGGRKVKVATKGAPSADYSRKTFLQSQKEKLAKQKAKGKVAPDKFKEKGFDIKFVEGGGGSTIQRVNKYGIQPGIEPGTKAVKQTGKLKADPTKGKTPTKRISFKDKDFKPKYENYEPYDLVLEYLLSTEQADTIEEANYIMTEMDAETIQGIVSEGLGSAIKAVGNVVKKGVKKLKGGEMKGDFPAKGNGSYTA